MSRLSIVWNVVCVFAGLYLIYIGIKGFDDSNSWIELFKGLFWILVGTVSLLAGVDDLKEATR